MGDPKHNHNPGPTRGFTLVELMITIAVLTLLTAIAIPAYNGYIREGHLTTIRANMSGLRTILEDYRLDNGNYGAAGDLVGLAAINARFNWNPSGDMGSYNYTISVTGTDSYDVLGLFNTSIWARCDDRFTSCCDPDTPGATSAACP